MKLLIVHTSPFFFLHVGNQVSHPHKTTGRIMVLCILCNYVLFANLLFSQCSGSSQTRSATVWPSSVIIALNGY
jgi:hypothetical protein